MQRRYKQLASKRVSALRNNAEFLVKKRIRNYYGAFTVTVPVIDE